MNNNSINHRPIKPNVYQGKQVILNSDRLIFNAKQDSILLYSNHVIGFSTNGSFHFDTSKEKDKSKFVVNSPNIYLGLKDNDALPTQPAVLGEDLCEMLEEILDLITTVYFDMSFNLSFFTTTPGKETAINKDNWSLYKRFRRRDISDLRDRLNDIKSKKTKLV
tara:strand:- start:252 stop:743 length:492 start_codon:yes stop_codon:yes gene_type:complete